MRIIAGKHRGRKLLELKEECVRPTLDRVRENLFNIISQRIKNSVFLDLFAGSGAVGIEALSRGAKRVIFSDKSPKVISHVKKNLDMIGEKCDCYVGDYLTTLKRVDEVDIIYVDPPYSFDSIEVTKNIFNASPLSDDGILIYESDSSKKVDFYQGFELVDTRKYGIATLSFLRRKNV